MGTFSVYCFVKKVLWRKNIIMIDTDFTESCKYIIVSVFGVCCPVSKKLFR